MTCLIQFVWVKLNEWYQRIHDFKMPINQSNFTENFTKYCLEIDDFGINQSYLAKQAWKFKCINLQLTDYFIPKKLFSIIIIVLPNPLYQYHLYWLESRPRFFDPQLSKDCHTQQSKSDHQWKFCLQSKPPIWPFLGPSQKTTEPNLQIVWKSWFFWSKFSLNIS